MRVFSFWTKIEATVDVAGRTERVNCFGGSIVSDDDAKRDALQRVARIRERIAGTLRSKDDYEADIREEVLYRVDSHNVVTRNRYGAEVLNSEDIMFIDVDRPPLRFWEIFTNMGGSIRRKERIVEFVRKKAAAPALRGLGLRLYETHKGVRVIVGGNRFDPKNPETTKFMRSLNSDPLYTVLCRKQACFRARLTPKPYRMKCRAHRVSFPRESADAEAALKTWLTVYNARRQAFCTCRYIETIGVDFMNPIVEYHDRATGAHSGMKLA